MEGYDEETEVNFCQLVGREVERYYGISDGEDLCFNLLEQDVIPQTASVGQAARIVAQYLEQA